MTPGHIHPVPAGPGPSWSDVAGWCVAAGALLASAMYLLAARRLRRRGDAWPWPRDAAFTVGCAAVAWAMTADPPGGPFTSHVVRHLVIGMAAPLLLVLARPLTLGLRALPPGPLRRALPAAAHPRPVAVLLLPPVAAVVDLGGLWLLHRTGLFATAHRQPLLYAVTQAHVLAAGLLFTFAVCQLDPVRRRHGLAVRGSALLAAGAAHAVLAKGLYAAPPPGTAFTSADLRTGAQLMYYGGDLVEIALAVTLAVQWYARRRTPRSPRSRTGLAPCSTDHRFREGRVPER
ncbi:cytochrome c oxidase assembly protein [Streptomyces caniscabiei]|uniref:cytochrome c oxidase assembly protein n=1 Tax=Streptomyces caniscabiei TaxID=2746961 RepID=UPI0029A3855A|nr:cytochrome c oxidase assembly protein [Streptomyces caniscabiei]MDX2602521.1 cytochrome c oxidase assembly protein [Streptomyces caniscabiei]MDX2734377.1 cytochrome c oxidase assembly protein [Streptomyces caniscabiei]MDX2781879.1 cytochrome c oxidase assembly protein [Streptomyces caniscabiei]